MGERIGLSEALLGVLAALAADAPEITSSVTALSHHQRSIGAGVVIGSNVFNLAALLGLGALVSGFIALHRKVVVLGGVVAMLVASSCIATITGVFSVATGLVIAGLVFGTYVIVPGAKGQSLRRLAIPVKWHEWISVAIEEEELELSEAIPSLRGRRSTHGRCGGSRHGRGRQCDDGKERLNVGPHFHVADAVIGAIVLAGVTSLPNAVAAIHLASRLRAAALSTALNSNSINVIAGLLIPGLFVGLARTVPGSVTAWWYVGLTLVTLVFAFLSRGLRRWQGGVLVLGYLAFVVVLVIAT